MVEEAAEVCIEHSEAAVGARSIPAAALLEALSQAFAYPAAGIDLTLEALCSDEVRAFLPAERLDALLTARARFLDRTAEQLAYTRLFIGSFHMEAPPYASYYLDPGRRVNGKTAAEVEAVYRQFGLCLAPQEFEPPDHLRFLLAFLALLARRFEETGDAAFSEAYADFRDLYVTSWMSPFRELVERSAEGPYFPTLLALVIDVLGED